LARRSQIEEGFFTCTVTLTCGGKGDRIFRADGDGRVLWRLDTLTGELEACGFESGQPKCTRFPGPGSNK